jgi:hypothetical protein
MACELAEQFCKGVKSGPGCWQANIVKLAVLERKTTPKKDPADDQKKAVWDHENGGGVNV